MKKILLTSFAIVALLSSCKKTETIKPEQATVEVYHKMANFSTNLNGLKSFQSQRIVETIDVTDEDLIMYAKNNVKYANDSIFIKVTYKGVTKQAGAKINSLYVTVGNWQLRGF